MILMTGIILSVAAAFFVERIQFSEESLRFEAETDIVANRIRSRLENLASLLIQTRAFLKAENGSSKEQFRQYVTDIELIKRYPSVQGLAFSEKIDASALKAHEAKIKSEGNKKYVVWPTTPRDTYFSIVYIEPLDWRNERAVGFDMFTEPVRRLAMERARDTGGVSLSRKLTLVQETDENKQEGFIIYLPVYKAGASLATVEERRSALVGFVSGVARAGDFFRGIFVNQDPLLDFEIFDGTELTESTLMFDFDGVLRASSPSRFNTIRTLEFAGHTYSISFEPGRMRLASINLFLPIGVGIVGFIVTLLIWWIVRSIKFRAEEAERMQHQIGNNAQRLKQFVEQSPFAIAMLDKNLRYIFVSQEWLAGMNLKNEVVRGKAHYDLFPNITENWKEAHQRALAGETVKQDKEKIIRENGKVEWIKWEVRPWYDGEAIGGILIFRENITARIIAEIELHDAKEQAETANRLKSAFLANMSHEIRTPMTAVLGFAEVLRDTTLPDKERRDYIERIDRSGRSLLKLIDDILDVSKVEAGKIELQKTMFSPLEIASEVVALLRIQAEQKGIELRFSTARDLPDLACSDPARVRQILTNLIANAVKFTEKGTVQVTLGSADLNLIFEVKDTGIGIHEKDQAKLFQPFAQADSSISRRFGGTGLGLMLSREIAIALGGDLVLQSSVPGVGSVFRATIPAGPFQIRSTEIPKPPPKPIEESKTFGDRILNGLSFLVADDVSDNQALVRIFLTSAGAHIIDFANNGEEAIAKAMSRNYDVVLMDIQMPVMDGIQATKRLRELGYTKPILALTAHAMAEEIQRTLDAGCNGHVSKPIQKSVLIAALREFATENNLY